MLFRLFGMRRGEEKEYLSPQVSSFFFGTLLMILLYGTTQPICQSENIYSIIRIELPTVWDYFSQHALAKASIAKPWINRSHLAIHYCILEVRCIIVESDERGITRQERKEVVTERVNVNRLIQWVVFVFFWCSPLRLVKKKNQVRSKNNDRCWLTLSTHGTHHSFAWIVAIATIISILLVPEHGFCPIKVIQLDGSIFCHKKLFQSQV